MNVNEKMNDNKYYASGIKMPKQDNYDVAYKEAIEELCKRDLEKLSELSGSQLVEKDGCSTIIVPFINKNIIIAIHESDVKISYHDNSDAPMWLKILLLHYLLQAKGSSTFYAQITYKQISGGLAYYSTFQKRSITPILRTFGNNFNKFISVATKIGGIQTDYSDYSVTFQAFPNVCITYNIWDGDDEFPPEGNVVFDSSIIDYFTSEDIVVLCNMIAVMIVKAGNS